MNSTEVIVNVKDMNDISKITENTKYINICIDDVKIEVIDYFLLHGQKFSYSDTINDRTGFIYVNYDIFKNGENIIDNIIDNMPINLDIIEKVRYIYISLGKILSVDINIMNNKNDVISFGNISTINNIWGSLYKGKITDISISKLFMYLCSRIGIKSELINSSINGHVANKVYIEETFLIVDLYSDIYNIQGGFITHHFDKFNNNIDMDKRVLYVKDHYMDYYIDKVLKKIDYTNQNIVYEILSLTEKVLDITNIGVVELSKIYRRIFDKYCPNYDIKINNFFAYDDINSRKKEHFIIIGYSDKFYSFNYNKKCFMSIDYDMLSDNLKNKRIGLYNDEDFNIIEKSMVL